MAASSSLSRLEFVFGQQGDTSAAASSANAGAGAGASLSNLMPSWLGHSKSSPAPPASTAASTASVATAHASAAASAAAASATAAAHRVSSQANEWIGLIAAKVQGKEHVPAATPMVDLEAGGAGGGAAGSSGLLSSDPGGATSSLASQFSSEMSALASLSWKQRLMAFVMCAAVGCVMLALAFTFVPMIFLGSSAKFAISYALGNFFLLASSMFLVGPSKQLAQMFQPDRVVSSGLYLGSLVLLFYVAWQVRTVFVVLPVLAVQFASLAYYVMSYVPFGQAALKRIFGWIAPVITRQIGLSS